MDPNQISNIFPLSPIQQGMLFHFLKDPRGGVDIEQLIVELPEPVDAERLKRACEWLVQRHEILRAEFDWDRLDTGCQKIRSRIDVPFAVEDCRAMSPEQQQARREEFLREDRIQGFELDQAPLLRLTLFQWTHSSHSLVWTFHHALLDGRSFPVLLKEVFEAYEELKTGSIRTRPEPPPFADHIAWLQEQDFGPAEAYWKKLLEGFSSPTPLVVNREANTAVLRRQCEVRKNLEASISERLREIARREELSMNSLVMSAWSVLLHRYSGEEDIVFGATRACRKSSIPAAEETVGIFINTIPVRAPISRTSTALQIARAIRQQWLDARPFEHTPLVRVRAVSQVPANQPLFETLVVFEKFELGQLMRSYPGWERRRIELRELTNFPITLAVYDGAELSCKIEFDDSRIDAATAERMLGHFVTLLEGIAQNPTLSVAELPLLTRSEYEAATSPRQSEIAPASSEATLHNLFEQQAMRHPDATALVCDGKRLSYRELNRRANRVARELRLNGVGPEVLVGLCMERTNELVIALLAILKAGGAYLPIDLAYPIERLTFMLSDAQAPVMLTETKLADRFSSVAVKILLVDEILADASADDDDNLPEIAGPDSLAYVIYTSGTTGKPKGSLITHRNVVRLFTSTQDWFHFHERDVWTLFHSTAFDFSVWEIWGALLYGGRIVVVPFLTSRSPENFYQLLADEEVTVLNQTPSAFRQLIQAEESVGQKPLALRYVIFGGEALEMNSLRPWFERHGDRAPQLVNMYGITETTVHVTYRPLTASDANGGSVVGVPIPDLQIFILDSGRNPVPIGVPGEIYVGGEGLARGYLNRPELTAERFLPDHLTREPNARLYRTGDLGRLLPNGDIEYLGRVDHQVKIRGFRIELGEIESVLCSHSQVREALVIAREDVPGQKRLVAYLVASPERPDSGELRSHLKKKLPDYMVPAAFLFLEKLPLTANGKVDRKALPSPDERTEPLSNYVPPRTPAETSLATIWANVLRLPRVSARDNFFELGGDSILGLQVISLARKEGIRLTPTLLFSKPTIAELADAAVLDNGANPEITCAVEREEIGDVPLTPIQHWFFEQNLPEAHHYNQAFCFELRERLDRAAFARAVKAVEDRHGALRMRYRKESQGWRQYYGLEAGCALRWMDLSGLDPQQQQEVFERETRQAQTQFDLERGPLWSILGFDYADRPGRLAIAVHHVAIDGVSWRILLEDLETAYVQARAGDAPSLSNRTSTFKKWSERLQSAASRSEIQQQVPHWRGVADRARTLNFKSGGDRVEDTEALAQTFRVSLSTEETSALLKDVPSAYNTRINDVLLTALTLAWSRWSDNRWLFLNLEGHGREALFEDVDVTRTMGWFTSVYPVLLELPESGGRIGLDASLKGIKEQLRKIPHNGIGYGLLRYLDSDARLDNAIEPEVVFNYFGQFDQVVANSKLFRFSSEAVSPWHAAQQRRRHALEVNCMVMEGRLEAVWTFGGKLGGRPVPELAEYFAASLREIIEHCLAPGAGGRTPSDFPLANLNQSAVNELAGDGRVVEDVYPLSPLQKLFLSADPGALRSAFDHWHGTLDGPLDVEALQQAWHEAIKRHPVLRTAVRGAQAGEPMQIVYRDARPPWTVEDWRGVGDDLEEKWERFLQEDRKRPLVLAQPPAIRFSLVRLSEQRWKFLWSTPSLLLDGWSWPLVFQDVSRIYGAISQGEMPMLEPVRPYRDYIEWLGKQRFEEAKQFWRRNLAGFRSPTDLRSTLEKAPQQDGYFENSHTISEAGTSSLLATARQHQLTLNTVVQAAWAILISHHSGQSDVVFGSAFSGRPTDLPGAESIVGPFVNNLPVRISVERDAAASNLLRDVHKRCVELLPYQFLPLVQIQGCSEVPWRSRLFDSIVVFQNYNVGEAATRLGSTIKISDFHGPIHTNYPVLLLAEPGPELRLTLICNRQLISEASAGRWLNDAVQLLEELAAAPHSSIEQLTAGLTPREASRRSASIQVRVKLGATAPQTDTEFAVADVWNRMFGEEVGVDDNFFEIGGHSLLLVRMYDALQDALQKEFPITTLFEYPTVRSLSRFLDGGISPGQTRSALQSRAERSRAAFTRARKNIATR